MERLKLMASTASRAACLLLVLGIGDARAQEQLTSQQIRPATINALPESKSSDTASVRTDESLTIRTPLPTLEVLYRPFPSLKGEDEVLGRSSQIWQNIMADEMGLTRFKNIRDAAGAIAAKKLVLLSGSSSYSAGRMRGYRYCLPMTRDWVEAFGAKFKSVWGKKLPIKSALRPQDVQRSMTVIIKHGPRRGQQRNINAAPPEGPRASSHMTGATVDIGKRGLTDEEIRWLRDALLAAEAGGEVEATEEFKKPCFHVMVLKNPDLMPLQALLVFRVFLPAPEAAKK